MARRTDPDARVLVFIDGQNAFKTCERFYGHGRCHPLLLADRVRAERRLVGVRYYTGVHDPNVNPGQRAATDRRHHLMRETGVTVIERQLRYRWEWGFKDSNLPPPELHKGSKRTVTVEPFQRAREKGIDLAIGLDVVDLANCGHMDVAIVISFDQDLCEVARSTHQVTVARGERVSVEAAVFNDKPQSVLLKHYDYTAQIRRDAFETARDNFDYSKPIGVEMRRMFVSACRPLCQHFR